MRMNKTLSLEIKIVEKLQTEENQSDLVNSLLEEYFKKKAFDGLSTEELKKEIEIIKLQKKIKELQNG